MKQHHFDRDEFSADELENEQYFSDGLTEERSWDRAVPPPGDGIIPDEAYNREVEQPYSHLAGYTMIPNPADGDIASMNES